MWNFNFYYKQAVYFLLLLFWSIKSWGGWGKAPTQLLSEQWWTRICLLLRTCILVCCHCLRCYPIQNAIKIRNVSRMLMVLPAISTGWRDTMVWGMEPWGWRVNPPLLPLLGSFPCPVDTGRWQGRDLWDSGWMATSILSSSDGSTNLCLEWSKSIPVGDQLSPLSGDWPSVIAFCWCLRHEAGPPAHTGKQTWDNESSVRRNLPTQGT